MKSVDMVSTRTSQIRIFALNAQMAKLPFVKVPERSVTVGVSIIDISSEIHGNRLLHRLNPFRNIIKFDNLKFFPDDYL